MKAAKITLIVLSAALFAVGMGTTAYAFHSGGVAECEGCHSMHSPKAGGSFLLVGGDQSSTCLTCHDGPTLSSYHISTTASAMGDGVSPVNRTPGGDFGWLRKTYTYTYQGTTNTEDGAIHGHNIIAGDFGYVVDPINAAAPGGTFPSAQLACNSCHDPHGQYRRLQSGTIAKTGAPIKASGSYNGTSNEPTATEAVGVYRLLAGAGYTKDGITFNGVPAAKAPSSYNQTEADNQVRVAYGVATASGHVTWGQWCATCHGAMHSSGNYVHPVDESLGSTIAANYNSYVKSGDLTGTSATAFSSLAPFATNSGDYTALAALAGNNGSSALKAGPGSTDQVMCLSCHRAHASGVAEMLRYDNGYEFMTVASNYLGSDNPAMTSSRAPLQHRGRTMAEWKTAYYDRPVTQFATYQRVFCNKCHAKD
ncbi:MAG: cytochrome C [Deltaproteobacteria bacterium]|nr:cytochrome C [Deltaproteobacteria bacterium]